MTDLTRRKFIQLTVLSGAATAAGLSAGCKNERIYKQEVTGQYGGYENRVLPYVNQPDGFQDGIPQYFATTCQMCPAGCGLFVRTLAGRAKVIEGNPDHPVSRGRTCARGQAAVQHLYNPDRLRFPALRAARTNAPEITDWDSALDTVATKLRGAKDRTAILIDAMTIGRSPTLVATIEQFAKTAGATITTYSLLDDAPWRAAARAVYGRDQLPAYRLDEADCLVSFGGNFLEAWPSPVYYTRLFGEFRQGPRRAQGEHGRFIYVGPRMSMTAAKADQWLPCNPGTEQAVAQGVLSAMGGPGNITPDAAAALSGLTVKQITDLAALLIKAGPRALAMGGDGLIAGPNATQAFLAVESLNAHVRSQCVSFGDALIPNPQNGNGSSYRRMQALTRAMASGSVGALLILGQPNPAFTLPSADNFAQAMGKVPFIAALTPFADETTEFANIVLPTRTFLEDWGDDVPAVLPAGARLASLRQPVIDPQYITTFRNTNEAGGPNPWMDTRSLGDILPDLARRLGTPLASNTDAHGQIRTTWAALGHADLDASGTDNDPKWVSVLSNGGAWAVAAPTVAPARAARLGTPTAPITSGATFALLLYPHIYWSDGRHAHLDWLQEIPDPMTSAVWNSWAELNPQTAQRLNVKTGDVVRISTAHGAIEAKAVLYPGLHPNAVAMPIGQGQQNSSRRHAEIGANPLAILDPTADAATGALAYATTRVNITKVSDARAGYHADEQTLVLVQDRDGGAEPEAVKDLIHTTAREWKQAKPVTTQGPGGSLTNRTPTNRTRTPDGHNPA